MNLESSHLAKGLPENKQVLQESEDDIRIDLLQEPEHYDQSDGNSYEKFDFALENIDEINLGILIFTIVILCNLEHLKEEKKQNEDNNLSVGVVSGEGDDGEESSDFDIKQFEKKNSFSFKGLDYKFNNTYKNKFYYRCKNVQCPGLINIFLLFNPFS